MIKVFDRIKEFSVTSGTGTIQLGGAPFGYRAFSTVYSNGDSCYYAIVYDDTYEIGSGVYSFDGSNHLLSRNVIASTNSNSLVNFGNGTKEVFVTYPAKYSVFSQGTMQPSSIAVWTGANTLDYNTSLVLNGQNLTVLGQIYPSGGVYLPTHIPSASGNILHSISGTLFFNGSPYIKLPPSGLQDQILSKVDSVSDQVTWIDNYAKEVVQYVKNSTNTTLNKGQVVYINGADGTNATINLAIASGESSSSKTLGFLKQTLANGEFGYVITEGFLDGLNTSAATTEGEPMWLSPTVSGGVLYGVANKPYAPNHMVFLGYVIRKQTNNGRIYVKIQNGFELEELHNVVAKNANNGDTIVYNAASGLWISQPSPSAYNDELAQDAIGGILTNSSTINFVYNDSAPSIYAAIASGSVTNAFIANGIDVAKLSGVISPSNLPSYVDDVLEYANFAALPGTGQTGIIYVTIDNNKCYRWSGSVYIQIAADSVAWGQISGILSNQTDLTSYLSSTYTPQTRAIIAGVGLSGAGDFTANRTIYLANTTVNPGTYGSSSGVATFTVDAQGRLTSATNVPISASGIGALIAANNLSDLASAITARTNLGLGSLATITPSGTPDGTKFLRDDYAWVGVSGYSGWTIADSGGNSELITNAQIVTFSGSFGVNPSYNSANNILAINASGLSGVLSGSIASVSGWSKSYIDNLISASGYNGWTIADSGSNSELITKGQTVIFSGAFGTNTNYNTTSNVLSINSSGLSGVLSNYINSVSGWSKSYIDSSISLASGYTGWFIADSGGNSELVTNGQSVIFSGAFGVATAYNPSLNVLSINSSGLSGVLNNSITAISGWSKAYTDSLISASGYNGWTIVDSGSNSGLITKGQTIVFSGAFGTNTNYNAALNILSVNSFDLSGVLNNYINSVSGWSKSYTDSIITTSGYNGWIIADSGNNSELITNGQTIIFSGAGNVSTFYNPATNVMMISGVPASGGGGAGGPSTTISVSGTTQNSTFYPVFVASSGGNQTLNARITTPEFSFNPGTNVLSVGSGYVVNKLGIRTNAPIAPLHVLGDTYINGNVTVSGALSATTKSFLIPHPLNPDKKLRYGSLESPYHGIRLTGKDATDYGVCVVKLPDYVSSLVQENGINIQLTPIGHYESLCIQRIDLSKNLFIVSTNSISTCQFYWSFTAVRKDIPDLEVEF